MDTTYTIALFGEAEKGHFISPYYCHNLSQLVDYLGNPPEQSKGLFYAIQALLYHRELIFFRVREEGFSIPDYLAAVDFFKKHSLDTPIAAFCLPGVGDNEILQAIAPVCQEYHSFLIINESDFYDYLTTI